MLATILEEIKVNIPEDIQKEIKTMEWRKSQPADTFLDPTNLKFPVKYNGEYRCDMIHAAIVYSAIYSNKGSSQHKPSYYKKIHNKAKKLSEVNGCTKDVKVQEDLNIDLNDIFEVYTLDALNELKAAIAET